MIPREAGSDTGFRTFAVRVLGCKVNQYEAGQIDHLLRHAGLRAADEGETPDVVVLHTCAVTATALAKSARLARRAAGEARCVILSGCGVSGGLDPDDFPGFLSVPSGPDWMTRLAETVVTLPLPAGAVVDADVAAGLDSFPGHTRAFLKIQDGCDRRCAYCIVPELRHAPRDKSIEAMVAEARALTAHGHRELVLTGVSIGLWGRGTPATLADAVRAVAAVPGVERLRLSSLHPEDLTDRLLAVWTEHPSLMPHFHLPLQSGSTRVLTLMRRGYTADDFLRAVERILSRVPDPALTTDVIIGFPGETEEDFDETLRIAREAGFSRMHLFPFSPRPGTPAAGLPDRVEPRAVQARVRRIKALADELGLAFHRRFDGATARVLCETFRPGPGEWEGYTERYIPVRFGGPPAWAGRTACVRLSHPDVTGMRGTPEAT